MSKAAYVPTADAPAPQSLRVLDGWTAMEGRLASMPDGFGIATPELRQTDSAQQTLIVTGMTSTRVHVDRVMTGIA